MAALPNDCNYNIGQPILTAAMTAKGASALVETATKAHWKILPLPADRERFSRDRVFSDADGERMRRGHIPEEMGDRWFIYFEDGWLYFHRSWTGACIFGVQLDGSPAGVRVVDCWVSRDREEYKSTDTEADKATLTRLITRHFLNSDPRQSVADGITVL
jgi:hypothetical protein